MRAIPNESRRKQYVKVIAAHLVDGTVEPQVIILDKGERFCIESVKEVKPITTLPPYEFANRYTVLIELFIQPGNSRHIDDRAPAGFLPDVQNDHHWFKQVRPAQKVDGFIHNVQGHQQIVQSAAL